MNVTRAFQIRIRCGKSHQLASAWKKRKDASHRVQKLMQRYAFAREWGWNHGFLSVALTSIAFEAIPGSHGVNDAEKAGNSCTVKVLLSLLSYHGKIKGRPKAMLSYVEPVVVLVVLLLLVAIVMAVAW